MKQTYIKPELSVHLVRLTQTLLTLSTYETAAKKDGAVLSRDQQQGWDIWGTNNVDGDGDYDDEY